MSESEKGPSLWKKYALGDTWQSFVFAMLLALTLRWGVIEAYVIPSASMLPSLLIHDHIFVNKAVYGIRLPFTEKWLWQFRLPERGEVIVFKYPESMETFFIKRVIGLPGDRIFYENGRLFVNDQPVELTQPGDPGDWEMLTPANFGNEDFQNPLYATDSKNNYELYSEKLGEHPHSVLLRKDGGFTRTTGPWVVPEGHLFMMGDNRDNSHDSRRWQSSPFLPVENILGRAMFVWLSCDRTLQSLPAICSPSSIRWNRLFHSVK
ncbi:MAG: signal peptidase I [Bdellovibrionales bacterium]|jgi:signal peptidase I|nr:signal peptidase I [Bdellovibrionales bacterium]